MSTVDDDVMVWVAARHLATSQSEFTNKELLEAVQRIFRIDSKRLERFVVQQCVANTAGVGAKHYNYLFRTSPTKYRLYRSGDPIEFTHATAPTTPDVHRVPAEHKGLFSHSAKFPAALKPVGTTVRPPEPKVEAKMEPKPKTPAKPGSTGAHAQHAATQTLPPAGGPAAGGLLPDMSELDANLPANLARRTIFDQLFLEFGKLGSRLETTKGDSFVSGVDKYPGSAHTMRHITVKLPNGMTIAHRADIVVEMESPSRTLYVDIVEGSLRADELKSRAYDAIHLRKEGKHRFGVLVFLRTPNGVRQEQAEAVAYGYDFFFGAEANDAKNANKFYGLKSQVMQWVEGKLKPERAA